jgi:hypothetical protein
MKSWNSAFNAQPGSTVIRIVVHGRDGEIFIPSYVFDALLCLFWNWPCSHPELRDFIHNLSIEVKLCG